MPTVNVPNIAALRAVSPASGSVHLEGFASPGDGGGGNFYWDQNNPYLLDDNIGIVITSSLNPTGRWRREGFQRLPTSNQFVSLIETVPGEGVNVKWFGAIGDGFVDDSAAIQHAINAASLISNALSFATDNTVQSVVTVVLPSGVYNITSSVNTTSGIEIPGRITLIGLGGSGACVLQTTSTTIPIIRSQMEWCTIQGITFKGGLHHVAMYGASSQFGGLYNPTDFGTVPSIIKDSFFYYPIGPAIWQDLGPTATIAVASNDAVLPQSTIFVDSTANFPNPTPQHPQETIAILVADGTFQFVNYMGLTATSFTGCTGGAGTLGAGMLVSLPNNNRTFQHQLRVLNFGFAGPHLFWGSGDSVIFSQGHIAWDFTRTVTSSDGLPLGIFNSGDDLYVDHVVAFENGTGSQPARPAIFIGTGSINVTATTWGQNDGITFVRARYAANTYQGAGTHPVGLPTNAAANEPALLALKINNAALICSFGAFWLEIYDAFPASISLKNWYDLSTDFFGTKGIWVEQDALIASQIFTRQKATMNLDIDGVREFPNIRQIYTGFDLGPSGAPTRANSTEITSQFILARVDDPEEDVDNTFQENLFNNPTADGSAVGFGMNGGSTSTDHSTGYPVTLWTAGANTGSGPARALIPFASLMPNNLPSGVYCFSFYWKANWDQDLWITVGPTGGPGGANAIKHFTADASYQRFWIPFYYPGNGASWTVGIIQQANIPVRIVPWTPNTQYAAGNDQTGTAGDRVTNGGNVYLCVISGQSAAGGSGPTISIRPPIVDNTCRWVWVGPGGTFTPECALGLMMLNKGRTPAPYVFPNNADTNTKFATVPRIYYGTAAPASGSYVVGDIVYNTAPASGAFIGWVCTSAGSPGTWRTFGLIS